MNFIKNALGMIGDAATGGLASGIGSFVSGLFGDDSAKKQFENEKELMGLQAKYNEAAASNNQKRAQAMWDYTNYENQKRHMINAGLNPAAVLSNGGGGSGATGASAAGVGGGQAANAAQTQANQNELGLQIAQMQLMQAQTEKTKAEAVNIAGGEKDKLAAEIESLSQGVKNMKAKEELDKAQTLLVNLNRDMRYV